MVVLRLVCEAHLHFSERLDAFFAFAPIIGENGALFERVVEFFDVGSTQEVVLLCRQAAVFQEVAEHSLEVYDDHRPLHLVHPALKVVAVCTLVVLGRRWKEVHFFFVLDHDRLLLKRVDFHAVENVALASWYRVTRILTLFALVVRAIRLLSPHVI